MNGARTLLIVAGILLVALVGGFMVLANRAHAPASSSEQLEALIATTTGTTTEVANDVPMPASSATRPYGTVTLSFGQTANFSGVSIIPVALEEDSRCPQNVQCIQAGRVRVALRVTADKVTTSENVSSTGGPITVGAYTIALTKVTPVKTAGAKIGDTDYRFTFDVEKAKVVAGKCYVGGCSRELCTDAPDQVSTCIYREQYACYQSATCARQASGQCGWTPTPALTQCLANAS